MQQKENILTNILVVVGKKDVVVLDTITAKSETINIEEFVNRNLIFKSVKAVDRWKKEMLLNYIENKCGKKNISVLYSNNGLVLVPKYNGNDLSEMPKDFNGNNRALSGATEMIYGENEKGKFQVSISDGVMPEVNYKKQAKTLSLSNFKSFEEAREYAESLQKIGVHSINCKLNQMVK